MVRFDNFERSDMLADVRPIVRLRNAPPESRGAGSVLAAPDGVRCLIVEISGVLTTCDSSTDIRKPATQKASINRPVSSQTNTHSATPSDGHSHDLEHYTEPVSDDEDNDGDRHHAIAKDEAGWADLPAQAAAEAKAFRDENAGKVDAPRPTKGYTPKEMFPKLTPANLTKLLDSKFSGDSDRELNTGTGKNPTDGNNASAISLAGGRVEYVSSFRAPTGKRVAIPVRVEPKVFFANERTSPFACIACSLRPC